VARKEGRERNEGRKGGRNKGRDKERDGKEGRKKAFFGVVRALLAARKSKTNIMLNHRLAFSTRYSVRRNISVQHIQSVGIFQYKIFSQ
jgi:hypothetical protein